LAKYSDENVKLYYGYLLWVVDIDLHKFKFLDEVHFVAKDVSRKRALSAIGANVILLREEHFAETYSFTALTSVQHSDKSLYIKGRKDSNTQQDFVIFIVEAIDNGYLTNGDYLVLENAAIHGAIDSYEAVESILRLAGVHLVYLPAYSPELNPIELVFAQVKRHLREYRDKFVPLWFDICNSFALVEQKDLKAYYNKCYRDVNKSFAN